MAVKPFLGADTVDEWRPRAAACNWGYADGGPNGDAGGGYNASDFGGDYSGDFGAPYSSNFDSEQSAFGSGNQGFDNAGSWSSYDNSSSFDGGGVPYGDAGVGYSGFGSGNFGGGFNTGGFNSGFSDNIGGDSGTYSGYADNSIGSFGPQGGWESQLSADPNVGPGIMGYMSGMLDAPGWGAGSYGAWGGYGNPGGYGQGSGPFGSPTGGVFTGESHNSPFTAPEMDSNAPGTLGQYGAYQLGPVHDYNQGPQNLGPPSITGDEMAGLYGTMQNTGRADLGATRDSPGINFNNVFDAVGRSTLGNIDLSNPVTAWSISAPGPFDRGQEMDQGGRTNIVVPELEAQRGNQDDNTIYQYDNGRAYDPYGITPGVPTENISGKDAAQFGPPSTVGIQGVPTRSIDLAIDPQFLSSEFYGGGRFSDPTFGLGNTFTGGRGYSPDFNQAFSNNFGPTNTSDMITAQELGEQGRAGPNNYDPGLDFSRPSTVAANQDYLDAGSRDTFDSRFGGPYQDPATLSAIMPNQTSVIAQGEQGRDSFDSRFGGPYPAPTQWTSDMYVTDKADNSRDSFNSRFGIWDTPDPETQQLAPWEVGLPRADPRSVDERGPQNIEYEYGNQNMGRPNSYPTLAEFLGPGRGQPQDMLAPSRGAAPLQVTVPGRVSESSRGVSTPFGGQQQGGRGVQGQMDALLAQARTAPTQAARIAALDALNGLISATYGRGPNQSVGRGPYGGDPDPFIAQMLRMGR